MSAGEGRQLKGLKSVDETERTKLLRRLAEASADSLDLELTSVDDARQNVVDSKVDRLLIKIVRKDDEPVRQVLHGVGEEVVEGVVDARGVDDAAADLPVARVKDLVLVLRPDDRSETHLERDVADAVVDVAKGRAHGLLAHKSSVELSRDRKANARSARRR